MEKKLAFIIIAAVLILLIAGLAAGLVVYFLRKHKTVKLSPEETAARLKAAALSTRRIADVLQAASDRSPLPASADVPALEKDIRETYVQLALLVQGKDAAAEEQNAALQAVHAYMTSHRYVKVDPFDANTLPSQAIKDQMNTASKAICAAWFPGSTEVATLLTLQDIVTDKDYYVDKMDPLALNKLSNDDHTHVLYIANYVNFQPRPKRLQRADVLKLAREVLMQLHLTIETIDDDKDLKKLYKAWFGDSKLVMK